MTDWQTGRLADLQNGRLADWQNGRLANRQKLPGVLQNHILFLVEHNEDMVCFERTCSSVQQLSKVKVDVHAAIDILSTRACI